MYNRTFEFKDLNGRPRKTTLWFNLFESEVFKLFVELKTVMDWRESLQGEKEVRDLDPLEVVTFYTAFEDILIAACGKPSEDGLRFDKSDRYQLSESVAFNAAMVYFVSNPQETGNLLNKILPDGMQDIVNQQSANLEAAAQLAKDRGDSSQQAEIERLRLQLAAAESGASTGMNAS